VTGAGSDAGLLWTYATDATEFDSWAFWSLNLIEAGTYKLEAYTDAAYASSKQATYEVRHAGKIAEVVVDQTKLNGWTELGSFDFAAGADQRVMLGDNTGEPLGGEARIVADAIRLTRVTDAAMPDPMVPNPTEPIPSDPGQPMQPSQPEPMPGTQTPITPAMPAAPGAAPTATPQTSSGCACRSTSAGGSGVWSLPTALLALGLVRRRRRNSA
jgi:MYXO-CTERM domain-containing protein